MQLDFYGFIRTTTFLVQIVQKSLIYLNNITHLNKNLSYELHKGDFFYHIRAYLSSKILSPPLRFFVMSGFSTLGLLLAEGVLTLSIQKKNPSLRAALATVFFVVKYKHWILSFSTTEAKLQFL